MFFRYLREHLLDALFVSNVETEMPVIIDFQARRPAAAADDMVSLLGVVSREIGADALARAGDQENLIISGCRFHRICATAATAATADAEQKEKRSYLGVFFSLFLCVCGVSVAISSVLKFVGLI